MNSYTSWCAYENQTRSCTTNYKKGKAMSESGHSDLSDLIPTELKLSLEAKIEIFEICLNPPKNMVTPSDRLRKAAKLHAKIIQSGKP
jgi:hypothetical protein